MSFLSELKRRNVFKVGAAYLALAWLVLQLTSIVVPAFDLPNWTLKFAIWFGVIGFPCALVFAWIYELTPEGLTRDSEVDPGRSISGQTGRKLDYVIIALLVLVMLLFVFDRFSPHSEVPAQPAVAESVAAVPAATPAPATAIAPAIAADDKSIAVLPFADMSQGKDQEYFSDGMSEEILNLLAQARDLKVIARTSSFAFKGKNTPIAEIAKTLGVAHVLEGSVRKSGNTVRITAQLVRAADSTHLWSETYDRPLDDIFKVQDEIAGAIAQALQIRLAGGTLNRREGGTQNLEAYQLHLRARSALDESSTSSLEAAREYLEKATRLDPNYGMAWALLAKTVWIMTEKGTLPTKEGAERARQLAQHALQVSPNNQHAHIVLQVIHQSFEWDWAAAEREGKLALELDPRNSEVWFASGRLASMRGRWSDAERQFLVALDDNPLHTYSIWNLALTYYVAGRFAESVAMYERLLELEPNFPWTRAYLAKALLALGRPDEALTLVEQEANEVNRMLFLPTLLLAAGRQTEADAALDQQIARLADIGAFYVAMSYAYRGDSDRALAWLDRAYKQRDPALVEILGEPLLKNIADDPRFIAFLKKMNLPTEPVPVNWQ